MKPIEPWPIRQIDPHSEIKGSVTADLNRLADNSSFCVVSLSTEIYTVEEQISGTSPNLYTSYRV